MSLLDYLQELDQDLLLFINGENSPFWDEVMVKISDKYFWIFFYVFIIAFLIWKFRKQSWIVIISIITSVVLSDIFASWIMKPMIGRLRPCWNEEIKNLLHLADGCGGQFGFISSHAANHFALATFLVLLFYKQYKWVLLLFFWAAVVSYSRIYLAAHYPGDVIVGAIAGSTIAWGIHATYLKITAKFFREESSL